MIVRVLFQIETYFISFLVLGASTVILLIQQKYIFLMYWHLFEMLSCVDGTRRLALVRKPKVNGMNRSQDQWRYKP
jgi:hypothetical protein